MEKEILHLILPLALLLLWVAQFLRANWKQKAKARNGSIPPRRGQVLPQPKDVNPGSAGFPLCIWIFIYLMSPLCWKQSSNQEPGIKSHHSATPQLCNVPTPNKMMTKQFKPLLERLSNSEVAGGYGPGIGGVSAGINHSDPFLWSSIPPAQLSVLSLWEEWIILNTSSLHLHLDAFSAVFPNRRKLHKNLILSELLCFKNDRGCWVLQTWTPGNKA